MDSVFCFDLVVSQLKDLDSSGREDLENDYTIEQLDKIDKAGVVDYPIVLDQIASE